MTTEQRSAMRDHFSDFDLDSTEFNDDYDEVLAELLEKCPVAHSKVGRGYYVVNRQEDVRRVAQDVHQCRRDVSESSGRYASCAS